MGPCVGFYEAMDINRQETKKNDKGAQFAKTLGRDEVEGRRGQKKLFASGKEVTMQIDLVEGNLR